jgi:hypothetical protein
MGNAQNSCAIPAIKKNIPESEALPIPLADNTICKIPAIAVAAAA